MNSSDHLQCRSCVDGGTKCEVTSTGHCRRCLSRGMTCVLPPCDTVKIAVSKHHYWYLHSNLTCLQCETCRRRDANVSRLLVLSVSVVLNQPVSSHPLPRFIPTPGPRSSSPVSSHHLPKSSPPLDMRQSQQPNSTVLDDNIDGRRLQQSGSHSPNILLPCMVPSLDTSLISR